MADLGHSYCFLTIGIVLITHEVRTRGCGVGRSGGRDPDLKASESVLRCNSHSASLSKAHWDTCGLDKLHRVPG
ncbi:hypothetical protein BJX66DRAFT_305332 [Aspergillus keveii]|uniref:Secreted protein n=1 Tax=Aspergillus keveii TaxID=714993 RepID=A0ABR4G3X3_9EURO